MTPDLKDRIAQRCGELMRVLRGASPEQLQDAAERVARELELLAGIHA